MLIQVTEYQRLAADQPKRAANAIALAHRLRVASAFMGHLTVELSCGPATPPRTNNRHCTGLTESAAQRAARQLQRVVSQRRKHELR